MMAIDTPNKDQDHEGHHLHAVWTPERRLADRGAETVTEGQRSPHPDPRHYGHYRRLAGTEPRSAARLRVHGPARVRVLRAAPAHPRHRVRRRDRSDRQVR